MRKTCDKCWGTGRSVDHRRIGRWAKRVREARGYSLKTMARRLKMSESNLSLLERGKRSWSQKLYDRIMTGKFGHKPLEWRKRKAF